MITSCLLVTLIMALQNVYDIFDFTNLVKSPTCYTKNSNPSLNDVILTNMPNNCMNVKNFNCGISDVHNLIAVQIKGFIIQRKNELKSYRSFKHFSEQEFLIKIFKNLISFSII